MLDKRENMWYNKFAVLKTAGSAGTSFGGIMRFDAPAEEWVVDKLLLPFCLFGGKVFYFRTAYFMQRSE